MEKSNILLKKSWTYILLLIFCSFFSCKNFTQRVTIFPYSSFGVGESKFDSDAVFNSIGKVTSSISNELDKNQINFSNPAANKYSLYTTFNLSGIFDLYYFNNTKTYFQNNNSTFSNVSISFPISKRIFFGIGCQPYTQFPYNRLYKQMQYYKEFLFLYYGNSGINSLHTFISYYINNALNVGLRVNYLFGNFEKILDFSNNKKENFVIRNIREYIFSGFKFTPGIFYSLPIKNTNYKLNFGLTLSSISSFCTDVNFVRSKYLYLTDIYDKKNKSNEVFILKYTDNTEKIYLPFDYSFGVSIEKYKHWTLGAEFSSKELSKFYLPQDFTLYKNQFRVSLGGFIIPNFKNYTNYLARVIYRFGCYYDNTGLIIFDNLIHQFGISFGLGLPIGENSINSSKLNIGFELGKIGKLSFPIHEEIFFKIKLGLNLSEIWSNNLDNNEKYK